MRLLFAGTPEVAVPALDALLASGHEVVAVLTRPDARAGRGRHESPSPVAARAAAAGIETLKPARASRPGPPRAPHRTGTRLLPGRGLRSADPAQPPGPAEVRLGEPALLVAPGLARRGPGSARTAARRRRDRRQRVHPGGGARHGAGARGHDRGGAAARHQPATCSAGSRSPAPACSWRPSTRSSVASSSAGRSRPTASRLAPKLTVEDARVDWSAPMLRVDRLVRACTPAPGAWTTWQATRLGLGPVEPVEQSDADAGSTRPGRFASLAARCWSAPATGVRCGWTRSGRPAGGRWPRTPGHAGYATSTAGSG